MDVPRAARQRYKKIPHLAAKQKSGLEKNLSFLKAGRPDAKNWRRTRKYPPFLMKSAPPAQFHGELKALEKESIPSPN
jgi:hypothetical protein